MLHTLFCMLFFTLPLAFKIMLYRLHDETNQIVYMYDVLSCSLFFKLCQMWKPLNAYAPIKEHSKIFNETLFSVKRGMAWPGMFIPFT